MRPLLLSIAIAGCGHQASSPTLTKHDVRPALKQLAQPIKACFARPRDGVMNLRLAIVSDEASGTSVDLLGADPDGLEPSPTERQCVTAVLAHADLSRLVSRGRLVILYPFTFASHPVDNRDIAVFEDANRTAAAGDWDAALAAAEHGLALTSFDGPHRRRLIEIAGVAACQLRLGAKAQHYIELASPEVEPVVRDACKATATALPPE